jgi:hypothetical protein
MKSKTITCTTRACYETRALGQEQLALKRLKENLIVFAYLTIQHIPSPSKWLSIDITK